WERSSIDSSSSTSSLAKRPAAIESRCRAPRSPRAARNAVSILLSRRLVRFRLAARELLWRELSLNVGRHAVRDDAGRNGARHHGTGADDRMRTDLHGPEHRHAARHPAAPPERGAGKVAARTPLELIRVDRRDACADLG